MAKGPQRAQTGGEGHLRRFPDRSPPRIAGLEDGMVAHGRQGAHGPHRPDICPAAPDLTVAAPGAAIAVTGGDTDSPNNMG
jgi:hypothetical protein